MALRENRMGQAGHALEVLVESLFGDNGFETQQNLRGRRGEVDVKAAHHGFVAAIECKEYNPNSTATVTRDMISNVAKKAELDGVANAVLVTTKPPSDNLRHYAREAGVILRSYDDVVALRNRLRGMTDLQEKRRLLIREFNLTDQKESLPRQKRREFLRMAMAGEIQSQHVREAGAAFVSKNARWIFGIGLVFVVTIVLAAVYSPQFRSYLLAGALLVGIGFYMWKENAKPKRRRGKSG